MISTACLLAAGLAWASTSAAAVRIVLIGDSTVCNYAAGKYPWTGWGQELVHYFKTGSVTVLNHAVGGRSSRSFVTKGQWAATVADLKSGDWMFIQFGHNDRDYTDTSRYTDTADYKKYLAMYIDSARKLGVHPVLVTPMNMNTWTDTTKRTVRQVFTEGANNYWAAMAHVAAAKNVPLLQLGQKSTLLMDTLGCGYMTRFHFMGLDTGEYPNYPTGNSDGTHFQEEGSQENARMVTEEIARQSTDSVLGPLAALLATRYASNVSTNLSTGGVLTKSRLFPPGATATIKVKVASGKTFRYWANAATGDSLTSSVLYTYTQDSAAHSLLAVFKGGTTGILPTVANLTGSKILSATAEGERWTVRWANASAANGTSVRILDLQGRILARQSLVGTEGCAQLSAPGGAGRMRLVELVVGNRVEAAREVVR